MDARVPDRETVIVRKERDLRVEVLDSDIRLAKIDWLAARDACRSDDEVAQAFDLYRRLISAQAQQIADDFRRG
jgi:hypothetical protein